MRVSDINSQYGPFVSSMRTSKARGSVFMGVMSAASKQADKQEAGDVLGISMIKEPGTDIFWGMKAKYASCSTPDNPVIYVETNYGGKTVSYNISVNKVDPSNASRLEMFALCSYADDIGIGDNSTFGTFRTLRGYEDMAIHNGYINSETGNLNAFDLYKNEKLNWVDMSKQVMDLLFRCIDLAQYNKGLSIMDMFSKYT